MSLAIIDEHRDVLSELRRLAVADLGQVVALVRGLDVADARELLKGAIPDLMDPFMGAASDAAAVLLDELYLAAGQRTPALAAAPLLDDSRVDALARWAVGPMAPDPKALGGRLLELDTVAPPPDFDAVLQRLTGAATRAIYDSSRLTLIDSVTRDPAGTRVDFQRMPRADCCAFCGMLASRPSYMAYRSELTAGQVVGRGSTRTGFDANGRRLVGGIGGGVKARGSQKLDESFHDDCRCVAIPILRGSTGDAVRESREKWQQMYAEALPEERNAHMSLAEMDAAIRRGESVIDARDTKAVLANWRKVHGTR